MSEASLNDDHSSMAVEAPVGTNKGKKNEKEKKSIVVIPSEDFDLNLYFTRYDGHTKVVRLLFVAERVPDKKEYCLSEALEELKKGKNTSTYRKVLEMLPETVRDASWADAMDKQVSTDLDALDAALQTFKANQDRKKIRSIHNKLGNLCYDRGDFTSASRNYMRSAEHCLTPETQLVHYKNSVRNAVAWGTFSQVSGHVDKAERLQILHNRENVSVVALFKVASGLAALENNRYEEAARKFTQVNYDGVVALREILSPEDVAIYGAICALSEFSRADLKDLLMGSNFVNFLETVPTARTMIEQFVTSQYADCISILSIFKNDLLLDIHMHDHIDRLYTKVRNRALTEYFKPYSSVDLEQMALSFRTPLSELENELAALICANQIQGRIDSFNKCLVSRSTPVRTQTFSKTIESGEALQAQSRAMLLRVSLTQNNMTVKPEKGQLSMDKRGMGPMGGVGVMGPIAGGMAGPPGRRN